MKQKKMKVSYAKFIQNGKPFDKAKCIEEKLKVLSDMDIAPTEMEMYALDKCETPRQIENIIRTIISNRWN